MAANTMAENKSAIVVVVDVVTKVVARSYMTFHYDYAHELN